MRDFICGQQTLVTCGGELLAMGLIALLLAIAAVIGIENWWRGRK